MRQQLRTTLERLPAVFRYLLVLLVVAFISLLYPNNVKFRYQFEERQSWRYDDLVAPFDFAIRKPDAELQRERDAIRNQFSPFYAYDAAVATEQLQRFSENFEAQLDMVGMEEQFADVLARPDRYEAFGRKLLDNLYRQGILELSETHSGRGKDFVINIVKGNTTERRTLQNLKTLTEVRAHVQDTLPRVRLAEADFLFPLLETHLRPNIFYSDTLTQKFLADELAAISTTRGKVSRGELIVPEGGVVTEEIYQKLTSFRERYEAEITRKRSRLGVYLGYLLLTLLMVGALVLFLRSYAPQVVSSFSKLSFLMLWLAVYSYLTYVVNATDSLSVYIVPFCIVPIIVRNFYSDRVAIFTHIIIIMIASFLSSLGYQFVIIQILAGVAAVLTKVDTRDYSRFFMTLSFVFLTYALTYLGVSLIQEGSIKTVDYRVYIWFFLNVFLTLLAYPLVPLLERVFGFTSAISLVELADMNRPLLKDLTLKAPGTLQHSLQVANLSEAAANAIGANPVLVKTAALYHDIGKMEHPTYFIENQNGGNPHEQLNAVESAKIIIGHVEEGVRLAKKYRLPKVIIDFIQTHHGTTRVEYFYRQYVEKHPNANFDENLFRYPGPRPTSKEETILMIADSVEAAGRSLKEPTVENINKLVDGIINGKIAQGQFALSALTFDDLETCREIFKQMMRSIHHVRIEYPDQQEGELVEA